MLKCDQGAKTQIQNVRESPTDENTRLPELEIELKDVQGPLSCRKGTSSVNEDGFTGSKSAKRDGCQEIDNLHDSKSSNAFSAAINLESQGLSYHYQVL